MLDHMQDDAYWLQGDPDFSAPLNPRNEAAALSRLIAGRAAGEPSGGNQMSKGISIPTGIGPLLLTQRETLSSLRASVPITNLCTILAQFGSQAMQLEGAVIMRS